jgi:hypothetical protein
VLALDLGPRRLDRFHDLQSTAHRTHGIVLVRPGETEVHVNTVADPLGDVAVQTPDHLVADLVVARHRGGQVLGVERLRERHRGDQVALEHRQQPPLGGRGHMLGGATLAQHEHPPLLLLSDLEHFDQLVAQRRDPVVVEAKLQPECRIRHAPAAIQDGKRSLDRIVEADHRNAKPILNLAERRITRLGARDLRSAISVAGRGAASARSAPSPRTRTSPTAS